MGNKEKIPGLSQKHIVIATEEKPYSIDIKQHTRDELLHNLYLINFFVERGDSETVKRIKDSSTEKLKILGIY